MNQERGLLSFYLKGFALANKSLEVYITSLVLSLITLSPHSSFSALFSLLSFVAIPISLAFSLSIPVFLSQKQQNRRLDFRDMLSVTIQNVKRVVIPTVLLFILIVVLLIGFFVFIAVYLHPTKEQIVQSLKSWSDLTKGWHPIFLIPPIILAFFVFTPFFFSLEHKGLLASIRNSFIISFKHLPYLSLVIVLGIISYSITSFLPVTEFWGLFLEYAINLYIGFIVTSSTLFYYQKDIS